MAAEESDAASAPQSAADEERWQTYLHYDQNVKQAVKRLGALSGNYVEEFRDILMKGRDRTRIKEYEAETIRRLQGEAFVGDHDMQLAFAFLHSEDPRLGEEFKKLVVAQGRPADIEAAVAAIRSPQQMPAPKPAKAEKLRLVEETKLVPQPAPRLVQPIPPPAMSAPERPKTIEPPRMAQAAPQIAPRPEPEDSAPPVGAKRLAILAAVLVACVIGLVMTVPGLFTGDRQNRVPAAPARVQETQTASPAPAAVIAIPAPVNKTPAPVMRAAAAEPAPPQKLSRAEPVSPASDMPPTPAPVPGAHYKVVRGDMLSAIALEAYGDASKFTLIQQANPNLRDGPDRIYYDQVIFIPPAP